MKLNLTYGSSFELIITTVYGDFTCQMRSCTLQNVINFCEMIFNNATPSECNLISKIIICDHHTGEIVAECEPSPVCEETSSPNEDCNYNEDMGFDPYLGCYTDDC